MGSSPSAEQVRATLDGKPTVVVVGAGYGGENIAGRLDTAANVIVIDKKNHFFHNIGALRPVIDPSSVYKAIIPYDRLLTYGAFIQATVTRITDKEVTIAGCDNPIKFDYCVIATGSSYSFPMKNQLANGSDIPAMYEEVNKCVTNAKNIVIVGGGPVGIELLGEIAVKYPEIKITLVQSNEKILVANGIKDELRNSVLTRIKDTFKNATIITGERVKIDDAMKEELAKASEQNRAYLSGTREVETEKGTKISADLVFFATGNRLNNSAYADFFKDAVNPENGRLRVEGTLQVKGYENIFAVGDCADYGMQLAANAGNFGAAPTLENNILQAIAGNKNKMKNFASASAMMVPLGPNQGAGQLPFFGGKIVGAKVVGKMKGEGLFYSEYWTELGYKPMGSKLINQTCKEINSNLTDTDITRLAKGAQLNESVFKQLIDGAYSGVSVSDDSKENEAKEAPIANNDEKNENEAPMSSAANTTEEEQPADNPPADNGPADNAPAAEDTTGDGNDAGDAGADE